MGLRNITTDRHIETGSDKREIETTETKKETENGIQSELDKLNNTP